MNINKNNNDSKIMVITYSIELDDQLIKFGDNDNIDDDDDDE